MFSYGKHFSSMYTGSMVGAGFGPYAVMGYVVANQQPDSARQFSIELNPVLLATVFGESEETVQAAIDFLCSPDEKSRTPAEQGRRLVRTGQFSYRVVNGAVYSKIRNEQERREQNRAAQERHRAKKKGKPITGEGAAVAADKRGDQESFDHLAAERKV